MNTQLLKPTTEGIREAARLLRDGQLVAIPTETVYGLGANGLDEMDVKILETICVKFGGGPVGLSTIAVSVGEEPDTVEEAYEPFLIMEGYLDRTPKGRIATDLAFSRLGLAR